MLVNNLVSYFDLGGLFMYPLFFFFFLALYFVIERVIVFLRYNWKTDFDLPAKAQAIPPVKNHFLSTIRENYQQFHNRGDRFNTFMELACQELIQKLEKNLIVLTATATLAPITGFLGTVTGMIIAFRDITEATEVSPQLVASGIYEALITTAAGLMVTIFSSFFYFVFSFIIKNYSARMEKTVNYVFKQLESVPE